MEKLFDELLLQDRQISKLGGMSARKIRKAAKLHFGVIVLSGYILRWVIVNSVIFAATAWGAYEFLPLPFIDLFDLNLKILVQVSLGAAFCFGILAGVFRYTQVQRFRISLERSVRLFQEICRYNEYVRNLKVKYQLAKIHGTKDADFELATNTLSEAQLELTKALQTEKLLRSAPRLADTTSESHLVPQVAAMLNRLGHHYGTQIDQDIRVARDLRKDFEQFDKKRPQL